jgi:hypothetical protein
MYGPCASSLIKAADRMHYFRMFMFYLVAALEHVDEELFGLTSSFALHALEIYGL